MRLAKARLLASLATTESDFLFILKIKMTARSSKRKSSQLATFTRKTPRRFYRLTHDRNKSWYYTCIREQY